MPATNPTIFESLEIQRRVVGALLLREVVTRYGRHNLGFMWLFIEPMIFTLVIATFWNAIGRGDRFGIPIFAFALTGYSAVMLWRNMPSRCIGAMEANSVLRYHRNVRIFDIYFTRMLLEAIGATMAFLFLSILLIWLQLAPFPYDLLKVVQGWLMTMWFGFSLGLLIGTASERVVVIAKIWTPISYIMFPLSGAIFMVAGLPPQAQEIVLWLPMVHGVECIRDGFFGNTVVTIYSLEYMAKANLVLLILGLAIMRINSRSDVPG